MRHFFAALMLPASVFAQTPIPTEFPADSSAITDEEVRKHVSGKVFKVKPADGTTWRLEYKENGFAYIDTSRNFRDSGKWQVQNAQLCTEWQRAPGGCSDVRLKGGTLFLKRTTNGEVIALQAD